MMSDNTNVHLTSEQAQAILNLCCAIKAAPEDTLPSISDDRTLASQVQAFTDAALQAQESEETDMLARRVMVQNATYAEKKIEEATAVVDRATDSLAKAKEALENAKGDMTAYYMLKDNAIEAANNKARKAMVKAGLAMLELDFTQLER